MVTFTMEPGTTAAEKGCVLAKDSFLRSELNFLKPRPKKQMAAYSLDLPQGKLNRVTATGPDLPQDPLK